MELCVHHMHVIELCWMKFQVVTLICSWTLGDPDVSMPFQTCSPFSEKIHNVQDVVSLGVLVELITTKITLKGIHSQTSHEVDGHS